MNYYPISNTSLIILLVISFHLCLGRASAQQDAPSTQARVEAVSAACASAITNICQALQGVSARFNVLSNIGSASIANARPFDASVQKGLWIHHHLEYLKNVRVEQAAPDARGFVPAADEQHIMEDQGVELRVDISNRQIKVGGAVFLLPYGEGDRQLRLICSLHEKPKDTELEKSVMRLVENEVMVLSNKLVSIKASYTTK